MKIDVTRLHDESLERYTLGACLLKPDLLLTLDVSEADFYSTSHRYIWRAMLALHADGDPVNTLALRSKLLEKDKLQAAGGDDYLLNLTDYTATAEELPTAALKRLTRIRGIHHALAVALQKAESGDLEDTVSAIADVHAAALEGASKKSLTKDILQLYRETLEDLAKPFDPRKLLYPGFELMKKQLGMLPVPSTFGMLADTNVGKSSIALEMLIRMAQSGITTGYISVEDQEVRVRARLAGMLGGVSSRSILQRSLTNEETHRLYLGYEAVERLQPYFHVSVLQGGSELDVCASMTELAQRGCVLVTADYLQKMRYSRPGGNRAHDFSDVATAITSHSQKLDICLGLISQMTRDKSKQNECPGKHDMKESGDLENMLDIVIGLWRESEDDNAAIWARLLKTKDGGVGKSWSLQRDESGRIHEVLGSDTMEAPDRKKTFKRSGGFQRGGGGYGSEG